VVVGVVGVVVAAMVVVYIYPLFSGPAAPYLFILLPLVHVYVRTWVCVFPLPVAYRYPRYAPSSRARSWTNNASRRYEMVAAAFQ
jgi:hypothetical protein